MEGHGECAGRSGPSFGLGLCAASGLAALGKPLPLRGCIFPTEKWGWDQTAVSAVLLRS